MQSKFNFFQHWYPLSPVEDIDSDLYEYSSALGDGSRQVRETRLQRCLVLAVR